MKYSKFIIIAGNELDWRIKSQFCLEKLVRNGLDVEFWNVSALTYNIKIDSEVFFGIHYEKFENRKYFEQKVKEYSTQPILFLVYMNYTSVTYFLFRTLSKHNCTIVYCINGVLPTPPRDLISKIRNSNIIKIVKNRFSRLLLNTHLLKAAKYQLNTCISSISDYKVDSNTIVLPFVTLDVILAQNSDVDIVGKPYYVFIDQYLPYHSDSKASGVNNIPPEAYYRKLNILFDRIENSLGIDVIIAAHPIAKKYVENNPFEGRRIFFNKTQTLVKYSIGVINHFSTAISFAVIYNKPSIALVSDDLFKYMPIQCKFTYHLSELIGTSVINIDHLPSAPIVFKMNEQKYNAYKNKYIVMHGGEKLSNENIILSIMRGDYE